MVSAKMLVYPVSASESVADLQQRIASDTDIPPANQELLLEAGLALEPSGTAVQCAVDYTVIHNRHSLSLTHTHTRSVF